MKLSELQSLGAFADNSRAVRKDITWKDINGNEITADVHIRRLSVADNERLSKRGEEKNVSYGAVLISELVLFDGERISYEDALRLDEVFAEALVKAIVDARQTEKN